MPDDRQSGDPRHTLGAVYGEMLLQITLDYPGLPDPRSLRLFEIRYFYDGIRSQLHERTKPRKT